MSISDVNDFRKKLKATSVSATEQRDRELSNKLGRDSKKSSDFLTINQGRNLFRLYPPHDEVDEFGNPNPFAEPMVVTYLPFYYPEKDKDGKPILGEDGKPKMKLSVKSLFNARIHGGTNKDGSSKIPKDAVEEFIRLVTEKSRELYPNDKTKQHEFAVGVYGRFSTNKEQRVNGILYRDSWVVYADKLEGEGTGFGRLEFNKSIKSRTAKISAIESSNEPLGTDPFTDPDEGRALLVIYDKQEDKPQNERKPEDYYTVSLDTTTENVTLPSGKSVKVNVTRPLSDENLRNFMEATSLAKLYRNVFTRRDFNFQLTGLKILDEQYKLGVFDSPEFVSILEEISRYVPEDSNTQEQKVETAKSENTTETQPETLEPINSTTSDAELTVEELLKLMNRDELKEYVKEQDLKIIVKPVAIMSDDNLRATILEHLSLKNEAELPATEEQPVEETATDEVKSEESETPKLTAAERLRLLKEKQQG